MKVTKLKVNKTTVKSFQFSSVLLLSHVWLFATLWTTAHQVSLFFTTSQSLLKLMSIESVMPSNHLILCCPLLLLPSISPSIRVFSNESVLRIRWPKYWSFSLSISPSNEYSRLIAVRMDWLDLLTVQGTLKNLLQHHGSKASILQLSAFFIVQLSHPYWKTNSLDYKNLCWMLAIWFLVPLPGGSDADLSHCLLHCRYSISVEMQVQHFFQVQKDRQSCK